MIRLRGHRTITYVAVLGAACLVLLPVWGVLVEPRWLDVTHEVAALPGLPPEWEGQRVALISDLHVGMWLGNTSTVRDAVRRLVAERPGAVLIAGDFLQSADPATRARIAEAVGLVRPLVAAGIPTYAVLGNHDYSLNRRGDAENDAMASALATALTRAGVHLLRNAAAALPPPSGAAAESLYVVGLDSHWAGADRPDAALAQVPAGRPYLVLMHNPASYPPIAAGRAPLALAAHTHGGQIRAPVLPHWSWLSWVRDPGMPTDGWGRQSYGSTGNRLYVTRGIGMTELPVRINCRPELALFTLRRPPR